MSSGGTSTFNSLVQDIELMIETAEVNLQSSTKVILQSGTLRFVVLGTGFSTVSQPGGDQLASGTMDSVRIYKDGTYQALMSDLNMSVIDLIALGEAEAGGNSSAIEDYLLNLNYNFRGNSGSDILADDAVSPDGVPINMQGDDVVRTTGGADLFYLGDGNDVGIGGAGNDRLIGGNGNDALRGSSGDDILVGGEGNDNLRGGVGNDFLFGNHGKDLLKGENGDDQIDSCSGNDRMVGGNGNDEFVFRSADDSDRIMDFNLVDDTIVLVDIASYTTKQGGAGTIIDHGAGRIVLIGVDEVDFLASGEVLNVDESYFM
jgi:Ca2+-binding RTX toxin-like protein